MKVAVTTPTEAPMVAQVVTPMVERKECQPTDYVEE